jgi:hypothetical protein
VGESLSHSTPITTAIAIAMMGLSFWIGQTVNDLQSKIVLTNEKLNVIDIKHTEQWQRSNEILGELKEITKDNRSRIERQERQRGPSS